MARNTRATQPVQVRFSSCSAAAPAVYSGRIREVTAQLASIVRQAFAVVIIEIRCRCIDGIGQGIRLIREPVLAGFGLLARFGAHFALCLTGVFFNFVFRRPVTGVLGSAARAAAIGIWVKWRHYTLLGIQSNARC